MHSRERRRLLLEKLYAGEANVEQMAEKFAVSSSTIRRDLQSLAKAGHIHRTYGGAVLLHMATEAPFGERLEHQGSQKRAIAQKASEFIQNGDTVILDAGSTVYALGRLLIEKKIRVITNNLMLAPVLAGNKNLELIILGGHCRPTSMGTFGSLAMEALEHMSADYFFTSADGVVPHRGLCEASLEQTVLKQAMIAKAAKTVVLADNEKINRAVQHAWVSLPSQWVLIGDHYMDLVDRKRFEETGATVILA